MEEASPASRPQAAGAPQGPEGELPTGNAKTAMVRSMFDAIAPRYDLLNRLITLGLDQGWRRRTIGMLELAPSSVVLDLACGTGDLLGMLQRGEFKGIGADLSIGMLRSARDGTGRVVQADASRLPFGDGTLDGIVSGFALRNFTDLGEVLAECARVLRRGGRIALLEVDTPPGWLMRTGHRIWFEQVVPRIGAVLSDAAAYRYLPRSVAYLPSIRDLRQMLHEAGFEQVERRRLTGGTVQIVTATCRRSVLSG